MANYGSPSLTIEVDLADGGALVNISQYVRSFNGVSVEQILAESHAFGDSWFESLRVGMKKCADFELGGFYSDDAAAAGPEGLNVSSVTHTATRSFKVTWGGTKTTSVETWILSYDRVPQVGGLTEFKVKLRPTGAVTEA